MWGYIAVMKTKVRHRLVPSLYVRVYRVKTPYTIYTNRSLIICEGISFLDWRIRRWLLFPHYMWGYIILQLYHQYYQGVPSLYVRVYHAAVWPALHGARSLIICEGISSWHSGNFTSPKFPHYMWGYIVISGQFAARRPVPSLHVSVYRNRQWHPSGIKKYKCSWR